MFIITHTGKVTAASTSLLPGPTPAADVWPICHTAIGIHGAAIPSDINLIMGCRTITRDITASISMSVSAGIGPVIIDIAGTTGTVVIHITGMGRMSLLNRIKT